MPLVMPLLLLQLAAAPATPALTPRADTMPAAPVRWTAALDEITTLLKTRHPDYAARIGRRGFAIAVDQLRRELPHLDDAHAVVRLMQLVASLHDGHTQLEPVTDPALASWYPVRFYAFQSGLYVTAIDRAHAEMVGHRVLRIGRLGAEEALWRAESVMGADNEWGHAENLFALSNGALMRGLDVVERADSLPLEVETADGPRRAVLAAVHTADAAFDGRFRGEMFPPFRGGNVDWVTAFGGRAPLDYRRHDPALPLHLRYRFYFWTEPLPAAHALYAQINFMQEDDSLRFADYTDSLFARLDRAPVQRLVLDLRYNSGGNGALVPRFVANFVRRDATRPWGRLYILAGRKTFSAAILLVGALLDAVPDAVVAGEPAGAGLNHFGDPMSFDLSAAPLRLDVSTIWHQGAGSDDVRPYVPVTLPVVIDAADYFAGRDPVLDLVLGDDDTRGVDAIAAADGPGAAMRVLEARRQRYGALDWWQPFSELRINALGYRALRSGDAARAVAIFALNTTAFPASWNAWDSYGEGLAAVGRGADAVRAYRQSLALNPGNAGAREFLVAHPGGG